MLLDRRARVVLWIGPDFERRLAARRAVDVSAQIDGAITMPARTIRAYLEAINAQANADYRARATADARTQAGPPVRLQTRFLYNPEVRGIVMVAPSLIMLVLMLVPPLLIAVSVVREKETGAIYNIASSTVTRLEFLLGKLLPVLAISMINALILWLVVSMYFGVRFQGEPAGFLLAVLLYVAATAGLGLLVSAAVSTQQAALMITTIAAMIVSTQFAGFFAPLDTAEPANRVLARLFPVAMVAKEWRQLLRDRALLAFVVFIFTLDIVIAAGAPELDLRHAPLGVVDRDRSVTSRDLVYRLRQPYFATQLLPERESQLQYRLDRGELRAVLTIPHGFERDLASGRPAELQLLVDASDANLSFLLASYVERIFAPLMDEHVERRLAAGARGGGIPEVVLQSRTRFNPTLSEAWSNTIAELLGMVTVASILLPAAALVREKERGTIEQLLVSPLTPLQIVLAKVLAMTAVILLGTAIAVLGVMHGWVGVPFVGSAPLFFALTALFAMTASGLGITAATFARSSGQVGLIVLLLVMPIIMLSGAWNLVESMPAWLQAAMNLSPLRHFVEIAYGVLLRGAGAAQLALPVARMALLGAVFLAVGVMRFRRQFR